jgi:hypothetical protein
VADVPSGLSRAAPHEVEEDPDYKTVASNDWMVVNNEWKVVERNDSGLT